MTPYAAQRIRFGILAARHELERHRLTPDQVEDLEGCEFEGWKVRDSRRAFDKEWSAAIDRVVNIHHTVECEECGKRGTEGFVWYQGEIMLCRSKAACDLRKARNGRL